MRIVCLSSFEAGSYHAHAINTAKFVEGFLTLGHEVFFFTRAPASKSIGLEELKEIYGLKMMPKWRFLPRIFRKHAPFGMAVSFHLFRLKPDLVIARDYASCVFAKTLGFSVVMETHAHEGSRDKWLLRALKASNSENFKLVVTISDVLKNYYISAGADPKKIEVLPTGVNVEVFRRGRTLGARPFNNKNDGSRTQCVYAGHLYDWKGVPTILAAAAKDATLDFHLVGGLTEDISRVAKRIKSEGIKNIYLYGNKKQTEIPNYLWHADVLLLPPSMKHPSARWTSPVKLGEYLSSGSPVVASSIPALRDWVSDEEVAFFKADDPDDLLKRVKEVMASHLYRKKLTQNAEDLAKKWSYRERAYKVLSLINNSCENAAWD